MRKDTNKDLDLLFKEGLEDAAVKVPSGVWKAVSARLDSAAPAAAAAPRRSWLVWGAPAFAFAAAALAVVLFVGNTEKTIIESGETIISAVEQPSGVVAQVEEPAAQVGGDALAAVEPASPSVKSVKAPARATESPRAGYVPKEIQTPEQISVLPAEKQEELVETPSETVKQESELVVKQPEKPQTNWVDPFAQMEAEDALAARKAEKKLALKAGGIVGGNDAHFLTSRPAFSSGLPSAGIQETSVSIYSVPVSLGLSARYHFSEKLAVSAGVNWSFLARTFQGKYKTDEGTFTHNMQYVGVPVSLSYDVVDSKTLLFYCYAGGSAEKAISSKYYIYANSAAPILSEKVPSLQFGLFGGIGVEFRVSDLLGLYVDPCVKYYFPGNQPKSIRTDRPLMFSCEAGLRFNL